MIRVIMLSPVIAVLGCATDLPVRRVDVQISPNDSELKAGLDKIEATSLTTVQKKVAASTLTHLMNCRASLISYEADLAIVTSKNVSKQNLFTWTNAIVGAAGSAAAPGIIASTWVVIVPILAFVWEVIGLPTEKASIEPALAEDHAKEKEVAELNLVFADAHIPFRNLILNDNAADALNKLIAWEDLATKSAEKLEKAGFCVGSPAAMEAPPP